MLLTFNNDGTAVGLWGEEIALQDLGEMKMRRASWIDFNEHSQEWEVRLSPHADDYVFSHPSREECIRWEHNYFEIEAQTNYETLLQLATR